MRNIKIITLSLLTATGLFFSACDKSKNDHIEDVTAPELAVSTPTDGQIFTVGDTISLNGDVSDASELSDISVHIIYGTDTVLLWPDAGYSFGNVKEYTIYAKRVDTFNVNTDAIIRYFAIDKHDNATTVDIPVQLAM